MTRSSFLQQRAQRTSIHHKDGYDGKLQQPVPTFLVEGALICKQHQNPDYLSHTLACVQVKVIAGMIVYGSTRTQNHTAIATKSSHPQQAKEEASIFSAPLPSPLSTNNPTSLARDGSESTITTGPRETPQPIPEPGHGSPAACKLVLNGPGCPAGRQVIHDLHKKSVQQFHNFYYTNSTAIPTLSRKRCFPLESRIQQCKSHAVPCIRFAVFCSFCGDMHDARLTVVTRLLCSRLSR